MPKQFGGEDRSFSLKHSSSKKPVVVDASQLFKKPHRATGRDHFEIILWGLPGTKFICSFLITSMGFEWIFFNNHVYISITIFNSSLICLSLSIRFPSLSTTVHVGRFSLLLIFVWKEGRRDRWLVPCLPQQLQCRLGGYIVDNSQRQLGSPRLEFRLALLLVSVLLIIHYSILNGQLH